MRDYIDILKKNPLFKDVETEEIYIMLGCLTAKVKEYDKDNMIFRVGDKVSDIGIVLRGRVHIIKEDFWGNRSIISQMDISQIFGETYATVKLEPMAVSVLAAENSAVLFLDIRKIMTVCSSACKFHSRLIYNMLEVMAQKNLLLTRKIECISQRTTREKLLSYLSSQAQKQSTGSFRIPFNRQQLADYLSVDRSAMSNELCKLRDEGILSFHRNEFCLLNIEKL